MFSMLNKILDDREKRYSKIIKLGEDYNRPVICGKVNYPGSKKNSLDSHYVFNELRMLLLGKIFKNNIYSEVTVGDDGLSVLIVGDYDELLIKKTVMIAEEEHPLGRLFDIDVYRPGGKPISRTDLGFPPRRCLICEEDARICIINKSHSASEIMSKIHTIISEESRHRA